MIDQYSIHRYAVFVDRTHDLVPATATRFYGYFWFTVGYVRFAHFTHGCVPVALTGLWRI